MTASYNFTIRAGNSGTVDNERGIVVRVVVADLPLDLNGNTIVWRVLLWGTQIMRKTSADGITVDLPTAEIVVPITVEDSRTLEAAGPGVIYDLERRSSTQQRTILAGQIFIEPGANDDE